MWSKPGPVLFFLLLFVIAVSSCKSKKAVVKPVAKEVEVKKEEPVNRTVLNKINANANSFGYYAARGHAEITQNGEKIELDVNIQMEKDKYIWMSVTAMLGIEVARVLATPDSLVILDRLHKKTIITNYAYMKRMSNIDMKLQHLQSLLIGNAIFPYEENSCIVDTVLNQVLVKQPLNIAQTSTTTYSGLNFKAQRNQVTEKTTGREFRVEYADPHIYQDNAFPSDININIRAEKNMQCIFHLSNFAFEKKKDIVFSIPESYEVVRP